jgi:sigma-B regulation protein RsbU (phosphoserine phosphatase)
MLLIALLASLAGRLDLRDDRYGFASSLLPLALVTLLVVLMLELKDKLLARDELAVGRQVQLALLPRDTPQLGGWKVWMHTAPANDVGGDLVDYLQLATGGRTQLAVILGDVAGKGLGAALLMAKLQATLRALAPEAASLDSLGVRANTILCRDGLPNRFATLVFALLEENSGHVRVLNAGHLPLLLVRPTDPVRSYPASSVPLGIIPEAEFHEQALELVSGDRLVVCSDGVTEARNENDEFFGEARLLALLQSGAALDGPGLGRSVIEAVARFAGEESQSDDVSLVIIERQA